MLNVMVSLPSTRLSLSGPKFAIAVEEPGEKVMRPALPPIFGSATRCNKVITTECCRAAHGESDRQRITGVVRAGKGIDQIRAAILIHGARCRRNSNRWPNHNDISRDRAATHSG